jgi:heterodisulfide reductase subunit A-like polyferredoxin
LVVSQREFDQRVNAVSTPKNKESLGARCANRTGLNPELLGSAPLRQIPIEKLPRDDCLQMAVAHS